MPESFSLSTPSLSFQQEGRVRHPSPGASSQGPSERTAVVCSSGRWPLTVVKNRKETEGALEFYATRKGCAELFLTSVHKTKACSLKIPSWALESPASPQVPSERAPPAAVGQPPRNVGQLTRPAPKQSASGLSRADRALEHRCESLTDWGPCRRWLAGKEFQLEWAPKTKHKSSLRFHSVLEGGQTLRVLHHHMFLHFLIWAGSEEARNHTRKPGFSIFPEQFYRTKALGRPLGASPNIVNIRRSDCHWPANQETNCSGSN